MRRVALLVAVLTVLLLPASGVAQTDPAPPTSDTRIHISVHDDGDARWRVTVRIPLENETDARAFEKLRSAFVDGDAEKSLSIDPFRAAVERVSDRTDQSMQLTDVERTTAVRTVNGTAVGHLTLSFTWTNFAVTDEERIKVGTAFAGEWFGDLGPDQTLLIEPPEGYQVHTVDPSPVIEAGVLKWDGPQSFGQGQPVVTFTPAPPGPLPFAIPLTATVALIVGAILGALVLVGWRREWLTAGSSPADGRDEAGQSAHDSRSRDTVVDAGEERTTAGETGAPATAERPGNGAGTTDSPGETTDAAGAPDASEPDPELLSDEERVERLLRENGGRMKQARIVEETRWSNAKVSQLLSAMAEEGRVEKLRLGRENLISLPGEEEV
ncbi:MAG: helix-turn-helix transcriptional regulator [Halanaeroarchaeum sp.]